MESVSFDFRQNSVISLSDFLPSLRALLRAYSSAAENEQRMHTLTLQLKLYYCLGSPALQRRPESERPDGKKKMERERREGKGTALTET